MIKKDCKKQRESPREQVEPNDQLRLRMSSSAGRLDPGFPHEEVNRPGKIDDMHSRFLAGLGLSS